MGFLKTHVEFRISRYNTVLALLGTTTEELAIEIEMCPRTTFKWGHETDRVKWASMRISSMQKIEDYVRRRYPDKMYHAEVSDFMRGISHTFMDCTYEPYE